MRSSNRRKQYRNDASLRPRGDPSAWATRSSREKFRHLAIRSWQARSQERPTGLALLHKTADSHQARSSYRSHWLTAETARLDTHWRAPLVLGAVPRVDGGFRID